MAGRSAARAIDAIRRGWPIILSGRDGAIALLSIEAASLDALVAFDRPQRADLLLSGTRAATLKLANQRDAGVAPIDPVMIAREAWHDGPAAMAIADPVRDLATPLKGPFRALPLLAPEAARAAIELGRLGGLLPAWFARPVVAQDDFDHLSVADIAAYDDSSALAIAARARLPVAASETAEIVAFRSTSDPREHIALIIGSPDGTPPLVRLHSECLTGDVLGSLKCDCGPQLASALHEIAHATWGVLLYLRQEGRGIGLINKLRAYQLQDQGFDTVDANLRLGFAIDARDFSVAARMLNLIGVNAVRLLTNNPEKVAGLEAAGISVVARVPHAMTANPHNARYLDTKRDRTGHQL